MQSKIGEIYEGKVTGLTAFGAFVKLSNGDTGMVHISEVAAVYVKEITDHLTQGQDVKVKVIGINENNKISLSIKQTLEQPQREHFSEKKPPNSHSQRDNYNRGSSQKTTAPSGGSMQFEDLMAKFKLESDEKMSDLKRTTDFKGSGKRGKRQ